MREDDVVALGRGMVSESAVAIDIPPTAWVKASALASVTNSSTRSGRSSRSTESSCSLFEWNRPGFRPCLVSTHTHTRIALAESLHPRAARTHLPPKLIVVTRSLDILESYRPTGDTGHRGYLVHRALSDPSRRGEAEYRRERRVRGYGWGNGGRRMEKERSEGFSKIW
jgi:hypothetical protein